MRSLIAVGAMLGLLGCAANGEVAQAPSVGKSPRAEAKSVFLHVDVERATGERIAGTDTQLDLMRPLKFSAYAADGSHVEVEIFAEPAAVAGDGYRVSLEVRESDRDGRQMSWRPSLSLASGKEAVASIDWAGDGRRLRVRLSDDAPLEFGPAPAVVFGTAPESAAAVAAAAAREPEPVPAAEAPPP